jgi:hypothetical protein
MSVTAKIPQDRLAAYFEDFTKRFLRDDAPESADVEVLEPAIGAQYVARGARLKGVTYDPRANALEVELDSGNHRVYEPREVWTIEEDDGFVSAIEIVRPDSSKEIVSLRR